MTNKSPETSSHEVIDLIKNKQPEGFNDKEKKAISNIMKNLSKSELDEVTSYIQNKVNEGSRKELLNLTQKVESLNNLPYGFEGIIQGSDSMFFNDMFESEGRKLAISEGMKHLLENNIPKEIMSQLGSNQKETIYLLTWNTLVSKIGFISGGSYMMQKSLDKMTGLVDSTQSILQQGSDVTKQEDFDITKLGDTFDKIQAIFESDDKNKEEKGNKLIGEVTQYLTYLTKDYFSNLNKVFKLAQDNNIEKNPEFQQLLDNPVIMNELLEKGVYNENGIHIDLAKNIITGLENNTTIEADKKAFMKEVVQNTNDTGSKIDSLKDKVDKVANLFVKFGFDSNELKQFQKDLEEIPLVGGLLSFVLKFFMNENVFSAIDKIHDSQKYKNVVEKAQVFFQKDNINFPFETKGKLEKKDGIQIEKFLKSVETLETEMLGNQETKKSVIFSENFWEVTFSKQKSNNPLYKEIQDKIQSINPNNDTMSQEDYFVALGKLQLSIPDIAGIDLIATQNSEEEKTLEKKTDLPVEEKNNESDELAHIDGSTDKQQLGELSDSTEINIPEENNEERVLAKKEDSNNTTSQSKPVQKASQSTIESNNNKSLIEQLTNINSLPKDIMIDGVKTKIDIGSDKKSIKLGEDIYKISVNFESFGRSVDIFKSVIFDNGKIVLSASMGQPSTLEPKDLAPAIEEIFSNKYYEKEIGNGAKLVIS